MLKTRSDRMAYFAPLLGGLAPTAPIRGGVEAFAGQYRGQPVWLVWKKESGESASRASLWLAMWIGHPLRGAIATDDVLRNRPPVHDAEFFDVFNVGISPDGVAPRALDTPATRAHVQRAFRGGGGTGVLLSDGYLWTDAEFREPHLLGGWREPSAEEVRALVEDVAHLAERFRVAFEERYAEIARIEGEVAARAWFEGARAAGEAARRRNARANMFIHGLAGCMALTMLIIAACLAWYFSGR